MTTMIDEERVTGIDAGGGKETIMYCLRRCRGLCLLTQALEGLLFPSHSVR